MKPSIRKLKNHIRELQKKYRFKIVWRSYSPHYDAISNIVYLPTIKSIKDYAICLHEIGHTQSIPLKNAVNNLHRMKQQLKQFKNTDNLQKATKLLPKLKAALHDVTSAKANITKNNWVFQNETDAWRFAFKNALTWTSTCDKEVLRCMCSYWSNRTKKQSIQSFYLSYIYPIFTE